MEMRGGAGALLLTEEALDSSADEFEEVLAAQLPWSSLPILLFPAGSSTQEAVSPRVRRLNDLAALTLLDRPIRKFSLVSAVSAALRARRQQYDVRDLLARLEREVRSRDEFLAILGHELRNPLGAILTAVQLMERRADVGGSRERSIILRQTRLLSRLVDDLLDVSRVASGKISLQRVPVDVADLVERCVQSHSSAASSRRISLSLNGGTKPWRLEGDPVRVEQVVNNLLTNSLKYTPPGGQVEVSIAAGDSRGEIRVEDNGVGIDPKILPRIFDLFTQADMTLDRSQGGMGIGLTLVRSLVQMHGGTVRAESPGPGQGSCFVVTLPRLPEGNTVARAPVAAEPEEVNSRRILVVEDNEDLREGLASLLRHLGHQVVAAENGEEGIEKAIAERPDVALVDIGLPLLDGYGVARRIREVFGGSVFLVALTGYGLADDRRRALEAGFDEHLTKPASAGALMRLLARAS
jgi:signal transduction histidine kinase/CheY-like chemotaxis protein